MEKGKEGKLTLLFCLQCFLVFLVFPLSFSFFFLYQETEQSEENLLERIDSLRQMSPSASLHQEWKRNEWALQWLLKSDDQSERASFPFHSLPLFYYSQITNWPTMMLMSAQCVLGFQMHSTFSISFDDVFFILFLQPSSFIFFIILFIPVFWVPETERHQQQQQQLCISHWVHIQRLRIYRHR